MGSPLFIFFKDIFFIWIENISNRRKYMKLNDVFFFYDDSEEKRTEIASIAYSGIMEVKGLENTLKIVDYDQQKLVIFLNNNYVRKNVLIFRATVDNDDIILFQRSSTTSNITLQIRHEVLGDLVHETFREVF